MIRPDDDPAIQAVMADINTPEIHEVGMASWAQRGVIAWPVAAASGAMLACAAMAYMTEDRKWVIMIAWLTATIFITRCAQKLYRDNWEDRGKWLYVFGLHEICAWCHDDEHLYDACPERRALMNEAR